MPKNIWTICAALAFTAAAPAFAQERFDTPEAATQALIAAADQHDSARLLQILGPNSKDILTSGNPAQDRGEQSEFARLARAKYRLEFPADNLNRAVLAIGDEDWPFPVPLVRTNGKWSFDCSQTQLEMHARRIGTDELDAIEICQGFVDAQKKYASQDWDRDGLLEYAPKFRSSPGKNDGLYTAGASQPLIPAALADAASSGSQKGASKPYHGYFFQILESQGPNARGGAHNYLVNGKLMGGFALLAWPAEYGVTGIHTFMVNQDGVVYEKDIEPIPGKPGMPITRFDPDSSWMPVD